MTYRAGQARAAKTSRHHLDFKRRVKLRELDFLHNAGQKKKTEAHVRRYRVTEQWALNIAWQIRSRPRVSLRVPT